MQSTFVPYQPLPAGGTFNLLLHSNFWRARDCAVSIISIIRQRKIAFHNVPWRRLMKLPNSAVYRTSESPKSESSVVEEFGGNIINKYSRPLDLIWFDNLLSFLVRHHLTLHLLCQLTSAPNIRLGTYVLIQRATTLHYCLQLDGHHILPNSTSPQGSPRVLLLSGPESKIPTKHLTKSTSNQPNPILQPRTQSPCMQHNTPNSFPGSQD